VEVLVVFLLPDTLQLLARKLLLLISSSQLQLEQNGVLEEPV